MKKLILGLAFLGLFTFATPKVSIAKAQPCAVYELTCPNGTHHLAVMCDLKDAVAWGELLC